MPAEGPTGRVPTGSSKVPPEGCVRAYSGHARAGVCCYVRVMWFGAVYARALVCVCVCVFEQTTGVVAHLRQSVLWLRTKVQVWG